MPAKNRNRERCSIVGSASTAHGRRNLSTPSAKNARMRARLCGLYRGWVTLRYRRAHCCSNVASRAHVILGVLHRWGRATRWLFEPSGFDSEAQTAASEEATSRKASRTRESRASEGEDERERGERSRAETRADGRMDGTQQDRFDSSATGDFYTGILNFLGDRVKDKQRRAKVQTDQGKRE
jgi:hypothetical protein